MSIDVGQDDMRYLKQKMEFVYENCFFIKFCICDQLWLFFWVLRGLIRFWIMFMMEVCVRVCLFRNWIMYEIVIIGRRFQNELMLVWNMRIGLDKMIYFLLIFLSSFLSQWLLRRIVVVLEVVVFLVLQLLILSWFFLIGLILYFGDVLFDIVKGRREY